ncbi:hypothetical protein C495_05798 [Natronorubrum sulfidifaciens JCM 14089]|uniref:Uncharacterized protein n=1 Tax=Natronorubrum sulfidifaciens JCM 14089 TaxID=1230460 RepID=L9WBF9_9EURY|nr:hypothetical protein C495_05798 [Natronorubrum sulfidifaciens JCM 14089]
MTVSKLYSRWQRTRGNQRGVESGRARGSIRTQRPPRGSVTNQHRESTSDELDLEFEWDQLCHGCGERKWFRAVISEACRQRHGLCSNN